MISLEYDGAAISSFRNSYGNETVFLGGAMHTGRYTLNEKYHIWTRINLYAGILIGYGTDHPIHLGIFSPGVYPTLSLGKDKYSLELGVMPTFTWIGFRVEF